MSMNANASGAGFLLPAVLNPTVAAAIGIGLIGLGLYRLLVEEDDSSEPTTSGRVLTRELPQPSSTVESKAEHSTSNGSAVVASLFTERKVAAAPPMPQLEQEDTPQDAKKQQMIREAMSELGKRSAAARARKKAEVDRLLSAGPISR